MAGKERKRVTGEALLKIRYGLTKLKDLPKKPKDKNSSESLHALLLEFMPIIDEAKEKGYSFAEIVAMINEDQLKDTAYTLTLSNFRSNITRIKMDLKKAPAKKPVKKTKTTNEGKDDKGRETRGNDVPEQSLESQETKDTPHATGTVKPTDIKGGKEALFGKNK